MNNLTNCSLAVLPQEVQPQASPLVNVFNAVIDGINQLAVNARDLHKFLKVGRDFTTWIKGRISQYVFVENVDYIIVENLSSPNRGSAKSRCQKMTDYHLTLDMAKELSMVENNEEGRKVRRYFIRCEKDLYKSDSKQREVLRQACEKLATRNMLVSDAYILVGKQFGYEDGIKNIPSPLLPEAIAFAYEMLLRLKSADIKPAQNQTIPTDPHESEEFKHLWKMIGLYRYDESSTLLNELGCNLRLAQQQLEQVIKRQSHIFDALNQPRHRVGGSDKLREINDKALASIEMQNAIKR